MVQRVTEVVGSDPESFANAVQNAVTTASKTLRGLKWFRVSELEGSIEGDKVSEFRALVRIYFDYEVKP
ncbi:MAG: dodecin family protein [Thermoplasmata archaeon]|jgi:flavin-binding protein dodecin|nr:dodecin family protein [Thermoplasmata archaeon]